MPPRPLSAIVLAAGGGTRMRSPLPKPLHRLCGRPMLLHVLDALAELPIERVVVVVGYRSSEVTKVLESEAPSELRLEFVEQSAALGTGDATAVGLTGFPVGADLEEGDLVVLPGDTPLLRPATLAALVRTHRQEDAAATLLTARVEDPSGYGRVVRAKDGGVKKIVEHLDASPEELAIDEVATSIYCFRHGVLAPALRRLTPTNAKGEVYLTDAIAVLDDAGYRVVTMPAGDPVEAAGVNDRAQLAAAEAVLRERINERFMRRGVTMTDPGATYIDVSVEIGEDVTILPGVVLEGQTRIASGVHLGPGTHLSDCEVGEGAQVQQTRASHAVIGRDAVVGPYAVLDDGCRLASGVVTGPFFRSSTTDVATLEGRP
ncbi:MAG TPA: NTP transferase domain-containing protein [Acidimicrobiales bacterium]|nr:NTP transferase domain-containing protein [Acidimicrobiales bacterium]